MEIVLNDLSEWILVKFIIEHNHPLSTIPSKSRMHQSHPTAHRSNVVCRLVRSLNSEGIGPSNIARICNAAGPGPSKTLPQHNAFRSSEIRRDTMLEESV